MNGFLGLVCCVFTFAVTVAAAEASAEKVITLRDTQTAMVRPDDILVIRAPMNANEWQVEFDPAALEPLMSAERLRKPPPEGWRLRVIARRGESTFTVTPISRGPRPPRFSLTVQIKP